MITPTKFIFDAAAARGAHDTNNAHNSGFGAQYANNNSFGAQYANNNGFGAQYANNNSFGAHNTNEAQDYGFGANCANRNGFGASYANRNNFGASCDAPYGGCWLSQQQLRQMLDAEFNDGYDAGYQVAMNDARRGQAASYAPSIDLPDFTDSTDFTDRTDFTHLSDDEPDEFDTLGVPAFSDRYDFGRSEEEFFNSPKEGCCTAAELFSLPKATAELFPKPKAAAELFHKPKDAPELFHKPKDTAELFHKPKDAAELFPKPKETAAEFFPQPEDDEPDECGGGEELALMLLIKIAAEDEAEVRSILNELICEAETPALAAAYSRLALIML